MSATQIAIHLLLDDPSVVNLVGDRVFPVAAPQVENQPYIAVSLVWEEQESVLAAHRDTFISRVSFACVANSLALADTIGEAVKGAMTDVVNVAVLNATGESIGDATAWKDGTDMTDFTDDRSVFRRLLDFRLRWSR